MSRFEYYEKLKALAHEVRATHGLTTPRVLRNDLRRIYRAYDLHLDLWPHKFKQLRGAYFHDELAATVVVAAHLPLEPRIFTMAHELKHHLVDSGRQLSYCGPSNEHERIEIGAEIFAAELIFPEEDFVEALGRMGVGLGECTAEVLVRLKKGCGTTLSYAALAKRAEFLGHAPAGSLREVKWKKLEEEIFGEPFYKRIQRGRRLALRLKRTLRS